MQKNTLTVRRALLSVSDKSEIVELATFLKQHNVEIISTGGTAKTLTSAGIEITPIEKVTGNPEAFGGRMKTISFQVESALLYRRGLEADEKDAKELGIQPIDLVVCNLYPFAQAVSQNANEDTLVENIDIGGPTMIRAAAKNYESVCTLTDPSQYKAFKKNFENLTYDLRRQFAISAFEMTAHYDIMIATEYNKRFTEKTFNALALTKPQELRYGENPHQASTFYQIANSSRPGIATAKVLQGKTLSYNNMLDADAAWKSASDAFHMIDGEGTKVAVSVIKHLNPCGLAVAHNATDALELAWKGDPVSAFGSIICFTSAVDEHIANWFEGKFIEILIAPTFTKEAMLVLSKRKNLRLLEMAPRPSDTVETTYRSISGGMLVQVEDDYLSEEFKPVTEAQFDHSKLKLARFGIAACKHLKSNAIALVSQTADGSVWLTGAGMGQPNRLDSLRCLAIPRFNEKEGVDISESVLISDAFFPFRDSIDVANEYSLKYIVQPGGSIRDDEVFAACDEFGIAMVCTGTRHFRH